MPAGGTFHGAGKALKKAIPDVKIVLAEPEAAPLLKSGIKTERKPDGAPVDTHPAFASHPIQGWTPDFIPKVLADAPMDLLDELIMVPGAAAMATSKELAANEGILTGISGGMRVFLSHPSVQTFTLTGGTVYAALEVAKKAPDGAVILAMLPDTGERYISTPLFGDIIADMDEAELEIAMSTPSYQLIPGKPPVLAAG